MTNDTFPAGWNEQRTRKVLAHYENQTADEQLAEHEAAFSLEGHTTMVVPTELVPAIRALIARHHTKKKDTRNRRNAPARRAAKQRK